MYSNRLQRITNYLISVSLLAVLPPACWAQEAAEAAQSKKEQNSPAAESSPPSSAEPAEKPPAKPGPAAEEAEPNQPKNAQQPADERPTKTPTVEEKTKPAVGWSKEIEEVLAKKHPENAADLRVIQDQVRQVVAAGRQAIVGVQVGGAVGSAVIVSPDGLVLTAGHVAMEPNKKVTFLFADGTRATGITLGVNRAVDSGMMRITDKGPWPFMPMAPAESTQPGDWVVGLGQPNGFFKDRAPPVRLGRVLYGDKTTLCTDVTLVGGDSGGPLFNLRGQVVGIHSRIGRKIVSNFHVPIDQYHMTWDRLAGGQMWGGRFGADEPSRYRPWLGVAGNSSSGRCELTQVYPGMPAARAGLKVGDVITRFDGDEIESFDQLARLVLARKAGSRVKVQLQRGDEELSLQVRLGVIALGFPGSPEIEEDS